MPEGPNVGGNIPAPDPPTDVERLARELDRTRTTIVRVVVGMTMLILVALVYMRCSDPYWRCKRLNDDPSGISGSEIEVWEDLECNEWPGI